MTKQNMTCIFFMAILLSVLSACGKTKESPSQGVSSSNKKSTEPEKALVDATRLIWMDKHLDVALFRNGDSIPEAQSAEDWMLAALERKPAWCYYENNPANGPTYGRLYNFFAVTDPRGLAPEGWRIPTDDEMMAYCNHLGGEDNAGAKMKTGAGWSDSKNSKKEKGFHSSPGGYRWDEGNFFGLGKRANYWSASKDHTDFAWSWELSESKDYFSRSSSKANMGYSVICVKNQ